MSVAAYHAAVQAQFAGPLPPNALSDVVWTREYLAVGAPAGPPVLLALAENWEGPSEALQEGLARSPAWLDGYQFSMWGEPVFLEAAEAWLRADQRLDDGWTRGESLVCAASWSGTRGVMSDIGRFLGRHRSGRVVYAAPAYDYGTVFAAGGFAAGGVDSGQATGFAPDVEGLVAALSSPDAAVLVVNAQQNPTACQWSADDPDAVLRAALARDVAVVFDDAHHGLVAPGVARVSAPAIWLDLLAESGREADWFAVRSLGKQLNCNGWGVGVVSGSRRLLEPLVMQVRPAREYNINARAQRAIGTHLAGGGADDDTARMNARIDRNRAALFTRIGSQGPASAATQVCTPFCWFPLPPGLDRRALMMRTGVLAGDLSPSPTVSTRESGGIARFYAGAHPEVFDLALARLEPLLNGEA